LDWSRLVHILSSSFLPVIFIVIHRYRALSSKTKQNKTKQNKTKQNKTKQKKQKTKKNKKPPPPPTKKLI
jgi:sortase (surface protein transpeptidase)